ncbi:uncharacterized protein LOC130987001 [Salvia miltiorrhiza]|uniref:uncharacterized protein LOC130987001 n=1 Tax=Salvia miltiorrhiza TaxID=226208 RepID=UPI0025AD73C0|nr:uncharacterized protein LOC130987001 [Salvia miltiorrhiza]
MASCNQGVESGSSEGRRNKRERSDKTRRSWSAKEEAVLLAALKELVAQGWKFDNGFRAGFLTKLEDALKKEVPGTDLKASPHINSKIGTWKKNYYSLSAMLTRSGIGFSANGDHMIDCNNDQWEQIVKCDSNARLMRYKSWPLFDDWKEIFGKDRATGEKVEDFMEVVNKMVGSDNIMHEENAGDDGPHYQFDEENETDAAEDSVCQSSGGANGRSAKKKRRGDEVMDGFYELLVELGRNSDKRLEAIAARIGYEFDLSKARTEVYHTVNTLPGVTRSDKFEVCEILCDKVERLELFFSLPMEARVDYLMRVLETRGK